MRPHCFVVAAPALDHDLRLAERIEDFSIEQLVSQPGIKTLDVAVFPWALGCLYGTVGPSRRQILSTRLSLTSQPA